MAFSETGRGLGPARGGRLIGLHSACGSGFLASAARGALCQDITGIFSWMSVFCATARAPSVRRASRWPILLPNGLFRFVRNEGTRAR